MASLKAYYKELSLCLRQGTSTTEKIILYPFFASLRVNRKILMVLLMPSVILLQNQKIKFKSITLCRQIYHVSFNFYRHSIKIFHNIVFLFKEHFIYVNVFSLSSAFIFSFYSFLPSMPLCIHVRMSV